MSSEMRVSVILTSFNHGKYLKEAIDSVLNQMYTNFELIIWDDASTDHSWEIINSYTDPRIKAYRNETQKRAIWGINKAISEIATGEYIAIHHSDDVWEPEKLEKQVTFLDANLEVGAVFTWAKVIDEKGNVSPEPWFIQENKTQWEWLRELFLAENHLCHPSVLVRKHCYQSVELYRFGFPQSGDAGMWMQLLFKYPIHVIQEALTKHRVFLDKSNTSADSPKVRGRLQFEWYNLIQIYRHKIPDFETLVKIFPSSEKYRRDQGADLEWVLAMIALEEGRHQPYAQLFALNLLMELISSPDRSEKLKRLYGFDYTDLIAISGRYDAFSQVALQKYTAQINKQEEKIDKLSAKLMKQESELLTTSHELSEIKSSKSWIILSWFREIYLKFFPENSLQARYLRTFLNSIVFLFQRYGKRFIENKVLILSSGLFDETWYLNNNPELVKIRVDPVEHYLLKGGFEGRDPSPDFSSSLYLKEYDDIRSAGINPLVHYLKYGKKEGRIPIPEDSTIVKYNKLVEDESLADNDAIMAINPNVFKRLKIVLVVHQFFPAYSSGTEVLTYETANSLRKMGHDVIVFTGEPVLTPIKDNKRFDRYYHDGIRVERFYHGFVPMGGQTNVLELEYKNNLVGSYFREFLQAEKPDIVHFFHLSRLAVLPVDVCYELGVPTVLTPTDFWFICPTAHLRLPDNSTCHGPDKDGVNCLRHMVSLHQFKKVDWLFKRLPDWLIADIVSYIRKGVNFDKRYTPVVRALVDRAEFLQKRLNLIDRVVVPTKVMMSSLEANGLNMQKALLYPYGLNLKHLETVKKSEADGRLRIGYIGTLYEHKGVHILVEAIKKLQGRHLDVSIYGNMSDFPNYVTKLKDLVIDDNRIKFCGTFPNREIGEVFSNLDVLVVPSLWHENAPLVIYSAQAAKCPVIASNMAGMSELIEHGKNGLLFPAGDVDALASAIDLLIADPQMLRFFSGNSKNPTSIETYSEKLIDIYHQLIDEEGVV